MSSRRAPYTRFLPIVESNPPGYQTTRGPKEQSCESCEYGELFSDDTGPEGECRLFEVKVERKAWCRDWVKSSRLDHALPSGQESPAIGGEEPAKEEPAKKKFGFQKKEESALSRLKSQLQEGLGPGAYKRPTDLDIPITLSKDKEAILDVLEDLNLESFGAVLGRRDSSVFLRWALNDLELWKVDVLPKKLFVESQVGDVFKKRLSVTMQAKKIDDVSYSLANLRRMARKVSEGEDLLDLLMAKLDTSMHSIRFSDKDADGIGDALRNNYELRQYFRLFGSNAPVDVRLGWSAPTSSKLAASDVPEVPEAPEEEPASPRTRTPGVPRGAGKPASAQELEMQRLQGIQGASRLPFVQSLLAHVRSGKRLSAKQLAAVERLENERGTTFEDPSLNADFWAPKPRGVTHVQWREVLNTLAGAGVERLELPGSFADTSVLYVPGRRLFLSVDSDGSLTLKQLALQTFFAKPSSDPYDGEFWDYQGNSVRDDERIDIQPIIYYTGENFSLRDIEKLGARMSKAPSIASTINRELDVYEANLNIGIEGNVRRAVQNHVLGLNLGRLYVNSLNGVPPRYTVSLIDGRIVNV